MSDKPIPERWRERYAAAKEFSEADVSLSTVAETVRDYFGALEELGAAEAKLTRAEAALSEAQQERDELKETLANSEEYRRAYQAGKMALYAMGSPFTEAAMEHLPCGEGALDRRFTKLIEMPRITALQQQVTQQASTIAEMDAKLVCYCGHTWTQHRERRCRECDAHDDAPCRCKGFEERRGQKINGLAEELTALRKHSVKQVELVTQQAATIAALTGILKVIANHPSTRNESDYLQRLAGKALASLPKEPVQILEKEK